MSAVNKCFGCGSDNPHGLHVRTVDRDDGSVAAEIKLPEHFRGAPGIAHGGIQATVLDEVMGQAAHAALDDQSHETNIVTVELSLRYRRPAPVCSPLVALARVTEIDIPSVRVEAELRDSGGEILTTAKARWRILARGDTAAVGEEQSACRG